MALPQICEDQHEFPLRSMPYMHGRHTHTHTRTHTYIHTHTHTHMHAAQTHTDPGCWAIPCAPPAPHHKYNYFTVSILSKEVQGIEGFGPLTSILDQLDPHTIFLFKHSVQTPRAQTRPYLPILKDSILPTPIVRRKFIKLEALCHMHGRGSIQNKYKVDLC